MISRQNIFSNQNQKTLLKTTIKNTLALLTTAIPNWTLELYLLERYYTKTRIRYSLEQKKKKNTLKLGILENSLLPAIIELMM